MCNRLVSWRNRRPGVEGQGPNSVFLHSIAEAWKGGCVFGTGGGEYGVGFAAAKKWDKVCIFFGGSSPILLRPERG